jgi:hypothetical protein
LANCDLRDIGLQAPLARPHRLVASALLRYLTVETVIHTSRTPEPQ